MHKIEIQLKQHTPIIHFQHHQDGATLRATELKPKLDRFIIQKMGGKEKVPHDWFINKEKEALNYKVKIISESVILNKIEKGRNIIMYYGNMGVEYNQKPMALSFTHKPVKLIFFSHNSSIIKLIDDNLPFFLAHTNFGTRQNKGYGSFFLMDFIEKFFADTPYLKHIVKSNDNLVERQNYYESIVFTIINYYYQRLKSGLNYMNHYQPSFLKLYLQNEKKYNWEKRWLKEKFLGLKPNDDNKKFARIMLGLGYNYTFKPLGRNKKNTFYDGSIYPDNEITINVTNDMIERFKSPITFKPIILDNEIRIYIFTQELIPDIADKEFNFKTNNSQYNLRTPKLEELINIKDLIAKYHNELTNNFDARDYKGSKIFKVEINGK